MKSLFKQLRIEIMLYIRQPIYLLFSLAMPVLSFYFFGSLYKDFDYGGVDFFSMFIPGFCMLILFSSGISNIGNQVVSDKEKGVYKRVMVTPIKLSRFVAVIILKNFLIAMLGFLLIMLTANFVFGVSIDFSKIKFIIAYLIFIIFVLSIGLGIAFISNRINTYSIIMLVIFFPMFMFSDAAVPLASYPEIAQKIANYNPLFHANKILRYFWSDQMRLIYGKDIWMSFLFLIGIFILIYAVVFFNKKGLYEEK